MKKIYFKSALLLLLYVQVSNAMDVPKEIVGSTHYLEVEVGVPLGNREISKKAYIQVPVHLVPAMQRADSDTLLENYVRQETPGLKRIIAVFADLMANSSVRRQPLGLGLVSNYDETLFSLLKARQTSLFYLCGGNRLVLNWDLGQHGDWQVMHSIEVNYVPDHPRKGTRSEAMIDLENKAKKFHALIPLSMLQKQYAQAGKKAKISAQTAQALLQGSITQEQFAKLHEQDMVAMALFYASKPENLKNSSQPK